MSDEYFSLNLIFKQSELQTGVVLPEHRMMVEDCLLRLRAAGHEVFCAVEDEDWHIASDVSPEVGVKVDIEEIDKADVLIALLDGQPSVGVQWEIGYANAKTPVFVMPEPRAELAYWNKGLLALGYIKVIDDLTEI